MNTDLFILLSSPLSDSLTLPLLPLLHFLILLLLLPYRVHLITRPTELSPPNTDSIAAAMLPVIEKLTRTGTFI